MAKISVIVPVYNTEKYLKRCLSSIINQTYKDLEILIINDGSTDNSGNICDEYAKKDDRIKVIHQTNLGVAAARNIGIEAAIGQYIAFIDSDDYIESIMIEELHKRMVVQNVGAVRCNYFLETDSKYKVNNKQTKDYIIEIEDFTSFLKEYTWGKKYFKEIGPFLWNGLYKMDIIKENKITFNEIIGEDYIFNMEYFKHVKKIYYYEKPLNHYVQHNKSATNSFPNEIIIEKYKKCLEKVDMIIEDITTKNLYTYGTMQLIFRKIALSNLKFKDKNKKISEIIKDDFFRTKIVKNGINELNFEKRVIYLLYKFKAVTAIILFINFVHLYYKVKERGKNK